MINDKIHNSYSTPIQLWRMIWAGHIDHVGEMINVLKIYVGKPGGRRRLVTPKLRWEDNIKTDLQ